MLGRVYTDPTEYLPEFVHELYRDVIERFRGACALQLPGLSAQELCWRLNFIVGALAYTMAGHAMMRLVSEVDLWEQTRCSSVVRYFVNFVSEGLQSPSPQLNEFTYPRVVGQI